jgi:16S rRNA (uracil1498-N3)-methyltransferase
MTRRRFYAPPEAFSSDSASVTLTGEETRHLRDVLRLRNGDKIHVFDGAGHEFHCEVRKISRDTTHAQLINEVSPACPDSPLDLTLAVALLKGEKFDLVVQKATELGVTRVVPVLTARADVKLKSGAEPDRKIARWQRITLEATKQCGRARLMKIDTPITIAELINHSPTADAVRWMFAERGGASLAKTINDHVRERARVSTGSDSDRINAQRRRGIHLATARGTDTNATERLTALVGSEGGWTGEEITQAFDAGWKIVTLGGRILRAETAAIVIAALLQHRFGDLK